MIKLYARVLVIIIAAASLLLHPHIFFAGELGTDFMIDLWKYRTGEAATGRPSHTEPEEPPVIPVTVTGTVDCLQDIPLHPNDIIEVQLLDFSSRSSAAVIAYRQITSASHLPIPFKLSYDPARINPTHHYTVQARIMRNGEPAYGNTAPAFVVTHGYAKNVRVLVTEAGSKRAARADTDSMVSPVHADSLMYIGTYTRSFTGSGGTVKETLRVLSDHTMELHKHYAKGAVKQGGVWSMENKLLAITLTHTNGEPISPERIVFDQIGSGLVAVEYDTVAHGRNYAFTRTAAEH